MKLYYSPGSCSIGIRLLLEEIGKPYDTHAVPVRDGAQHKPEYVAVNPKSKVPALERDDGSVLTEFGAIAYWLAATNPDAHLLPSVPEAAARALEVIDYVTATMHMQGFTRMVRPAAFSPTEGDAAAVKARGVEIFNKAMGLLDQGLAGRDYAVGAYSIADAALFFVECWAARSPDVTPMPANIAAHWARMKGRPAAQRAMAAEGITV